MVRSTVAALLGAIIVFAWSFVSWVVLPWHSWDMKSFKQGGEVVAQALRVEALEPGIYTLPNLIKSTQHVMENEKDWTDKTKMEKEWAEKAHTGPFAYLNVYPSGYKWNMQMALGYQFLIQLITALIAVWLLNRSALITVFHRALFVTIAVTVGTFLCSASNWNWWGFPIATTAVYVADSLIAWFLAGLVMAKVAR